MSTVPGQRSTARSRNPSASTSSRRRGASSGSSTPTWRTRPAGCWRRTAQTRASSRSSPTAATPRSQVDVARLRTVTAELREEAAKALEPTGLAPATVDINAFVQMCYPGQNFDMSVPAPTDDAFTEPTLLDLAGRSHDQHERERGFCFRDQQPLVRGMRVVARGNTPKPDRFAPDGPETDPADARTRSRPVYFGVEFIDTPVFDGPRLAPGIELTGPALIEEPFTVVVVPPGATASLDDHGNYDLTLG